MGDIKDIRKGDSLEFLVVDAAQSTGDDSYRSDVLGTAMIVFSHWFPCGYVGNPTLFAADSKTIAGSLTVTVEIGGADSNGYVASSSDVVHEKRGVVSAAPAATTVSCASMRPLYHNVAAAPPVASEALGRSIWGGAAIEAKFTNLRKSRKMKKVEKSKKV